MIIIFHCRDKYKISREEKGKFKNLIETKNKSLN